MTFVIDTSSGVSGLAILDPSGTVHFEMFLSARSPDAIDRMRATAARHRLTRVAVAIGPGSFTGLRVGVSFGLGLAIGLKIPIVPLPTLELQAARSDLPVIAVSEAGRGRLYYLVPGRRTALGEPGELPKTHFLAGMLSPPMEAAVSVAGLRFRPGEEMRSFGQAAANLLESASEVAYDRLRLEYMPSFTASGKS